MPDVAVLSVRVNADTSPAESALGGFGSKLGGIIGTGVVAAGAAVAAGVAVGVKAAGDLEQAVANISTIKPEIDTSAVFAALNDMSTRVPQSSKQLGDALYNVFSSIDVSSEQALKLVETFARGAVGAQTDAETFGTSILGVLNAYGLAAENAGHVSDVFFNTVNKGVVTGQELAASLGPVTQSAKLAGVSLDELGGLIAGVTKEGGPAAQNINNLNNFLEKINTKDAAKGFAELGINVANADGSMRPVVNVLGDLKTATAGMTDEARVLAIQKIFPDLQARTGAAVLMSQLDFVRAAIEDNKTSAGSAEAAYAKMSETFNSQSKLLMNGLMSILTTVGAQVLPAITPLIKAFAESLPGAFKAAQDALTPVGAALQPVFAIITDGWRTVQQIFSNDWSPSDQINPFVNALGILATFLRDQVMPVVRTVAGFIVQQFGGVVSWVQDNLPLIQKTVQVILANISAMWDAHGSAITTIVQTLWTVITTVIGNSIKMIGDLLKLGMQVITGDWSGAWATVKDIVSLQWDSITTVIGGALTIIGTLIDDRTGGMLTAITTWMSDSLASVTGGMASIGKTIGGAWDDISSTVDTIHQAIKNIITAAWELIYTSVIKPKLDAISSFIGTTWETIRSAVETKVNAARDLIALAWDAVQTTATTILSAVLAYVRDTIFEPIRAAIETKINAARDLFGQALDAVSASAHAVLDPLLAFWRDTIWEPIRAAVDNAVYGPKGAYTQFASAVGAIRGVVDGTLQGVRSAWEGTWAAIQKAAESPQKAMEVIIDLVNKLKDIMPEWLIPHSPTPFQIGLEGIIKAAREMDGAFGSMGASVSGAVTDWLQAAMKLAGVGDNWLPGLQRLVSWESSGNPTARNPEAVNGQHATGLLQTLPSTFRHYALPGMGDITNPIHNAAAAIRYIKDTYGSVYDIPGIKSGNHGDFPGYAEGGWVGLHGPELGLLGERGPEYVVPNSALRGGGSGGGLLERHEIAITIGGREAERIYVTGRQLAIRRGRE